MKRRVDGCTMERILLMTDVLDFSVPFDSIDDIPPSLKLFLASMTS
jgi:hypothetical protein